MSPWLRQMCLYCNEADDVASSLDQWIEEAGWLADIRYLTRYGKFWRQNKRMASSTAAVDESFIPSFKPEKKDDCTICHIYIHSFDRSGHRLSDLPPFANRLYATRLVLA